MKPCRRYKLSLIAFCFSHLVQIGGDQPRLGPKGTASRLHPVIRSIGLARETTKITLAQIAYNFIRLVWLEAADRTRLTLGPAGD